ncbi:MAG: hypothetical protein JKY48_15950 [Flavobacteriales bacterium]|nr:hypothetical protein [Flavobacteriales bacterium]
MKNSKNSIKMLMFSGIMGIALTATACNNKNTYTSEKEHECSKNCTDSKTDHQVKEADILFKEGKVIEIAYASIEGGKEVQLNRDYFAKILPLAAKYEGKMLGSLEVTAITDGEIHPQLIAIFEWPNIEARDKLLADSEAQKLFPIRDAALTSIKLAYFKVEEDVKVTFREDKTYEFFNAWLTPKSKTALPEYFKQSAEVKKKYGPPVFVASLKPINNLPSADYLLQPDMSGIVEWGSTSDYYGLIADPEFKKAAPLLEKSVKRLDGINAKFNFPQQ